MALQIRPAEPDDSYALAQIGLAAWLAGIAPLLEDLQEEELLTIEQLFQSFLSAHFSKDTTASDAPQTGCASYLNCADLGGQLVGFYALQTSLGNRAYLSDLWVAPQWHGQGIATPLVQDALQKCRLHRQTGLELKVLADNKRALAFYEKNGFCEQRRAVVLEPMLKRHLSRVEMLCRF